MFARWYLILFILSLLFFLFVAGYNLYENYKVRKNCSVTCEENQNILLILNIIVIVLVFILIIGFFFAREKNNVEKIIQGQGLQGQGLQGQGLQGQGLQGQGIQGQVQQPQQIGLKGQVLQGQGLQPIQASSKISSAPINMKYNSEQCNSPFECGGTIDIISKI
jgi:hypothetical protein